MKNYIIALDQGTTSSRAIIFDNECNVIASAQKELAQIYPNEGFVEHDPMEIYSSQYSVMCEALAVSDIDLASVAAIGITNQRETTIVWDKNTGDPIYNAIVWQCRRTTGICEQMKIRGLEQYVRENTGLRIDAYFSASKVKWILDNVDGARDKALSGNLLFGTVDTWLVWKLTGGKVHVTDYTNASRTMLYNIKDLCWDEKLLNEFEIPKSMLPQVKSSSEIYATVNISGYEIPISGIAGDQHAALFGEACFNKGDVKNTYGTGCFLLLNTGEEMHLSSNGMITTIAIGIGDKITYAIEGSVFVGGAVIQWLRDELQIIDNAGATCELAMSLIDNGGVYIVPAFTGLGAPHWDMYARGAVFGLTRGSSRAHFARAALESIAYQTADVIRALEADTQVKISSLKVDGGASANDFLMQFQSDIIDAQVIRPNVLETTALGAAYLAGLAVGVWHSTDEIASKWVSGKRFSPSMLEEKRKCNLNGWKRAVLCSKEWVDR